MNEIHRVNMAQLASYLESGKLRAAFSMGEFGDRGSIGCAIGHAPYAGIEKNTGEDWEQYSERVFGLIPYENEWHWCFGPSWEKIDNTPEGAAKRIRYFLANGLPHNWDMQMFGNVPISYA